MKKSTSTCIPRKSKCASGARNLSTILCATRFARRSWVRGRSPVLPLPLPQRKTDRKSTRLNSSHSQISYAVFCLKKKIHTRSRSASAPDRDDRSHQDLDEQVVSVVQDPETPRLLLE